MKKTKFKSLVGVDSDLLFEKKLKEIYITKPISIEKKIPIFSKNDVYIDNYNKISHDHLEILKQSEKNPFIAEEIWQKLESSTQKLINEFVPKKSKILDVGIGLGRLLEPLKDYRRYGVDISLEYLYEAQKKGIEVAMAKIEELPYKKDFFDAVVCCDVLEHVLDLNFCCEKILNCLRPGGIFIIRVPFREDTSGYLDKNLSPYDFVHLRSFDESNIRLHFEKIFGLKFVQANTVVPYFNLSSRLKLKLIPQNVLNELDEYVKSNLDSFGKFLKVIDAFKISEEEFSKWAVNLRDNEPLFFEKISKYLVYGLEINMIFEKPTKLNKINKEIKELRTKYYN